MINKFTPRRVVLFLIIVGTVWFSLYKGRPPAVVPARAPESEFSAERAMRHIAPISQEPHVTGSPEIYRVRDYIVGELTGLGINSELQIVLAQNPFNDSEVALVENILARLPGTKTNQAVVIVGHYDTTPYSPGAADDGAAVATLLETARALKAAPPLDNDVVLVFSDAEESTIGGAFAAIEHPWLSEIALVVNLEMRGNNGPVYAFETGPDNGRIIPEFAKAVPYPLSSSLMRDVYNNMPNNTDFTAFREAGYPGFNYSTLEGYTTYHTLLDTVATLDPRSLQHHGTYTLGIARHFGNLDLQNIKASDAVYFDLLGTTLIHYPGFLAIPLMILVILLFAGLVIIGLRKGDLTPRGIFLGFLAFMVVLVSGPGAVTLLWYLIRATVNPPVIHGDTYNSPLYFLGFGLLIVAITAALYSLFRRRVSISNLAVGALLWWAIFLLVVTFIFPLANFIFLWPLLFSLIGVGDLILTKHQTPLSWIGVIILYIAALPGLLLLPVPTYAMAQGLLTLVSVTGAGLVLVSLLIGLLVPHLAAITWSDKWLGQRWLSAGSALIGAAVVIVAMITVRADAQHPRLIHLIYGLDTHTGEAFWASLRSSEYSQEWTANFFSEQATYGPLPQFFGTDRRQLEFDHAPVLPLSPPDIDVLDNTLNGDLRKLRLSVTSLRGATQMSFYIAPPAEILSVVVNGKPMRVAENPPDREEMWDFHYYGPLTSGMELDLEVRSPRAVEMFIVEGVAGLPDIQDHSIPAQPDHLIPSAHLNRWDSHVTLISSSLTFGE